jgi:hypothetical protein
VRSPNSGAHTVLPIAVVRFFRRHIDELERDSRMQRLTLQEVPLALIFDSKSYEYHLLVRHVASFC